MSDSITSSELQLIIGLINNARLNGITEITYKDLKVRIAPLGLTDSRTGTPQAYTARANWDAVIPVDGT